MENKKLFFPSKQVSAISGTLKNGSSKDKSNDITEFKSSQEDIADYFEHNNHETILNRLKSMHLGETSKSATDGERTIFYSLLQNATNADQILKQCLDDCVSLSEEDENDPKCAIKVDLTLLLGGETQYQAGIINDMLSFQSFDAVKDLLLHPVIRTFVEMKWAKIKGFVFINFLTYVVFLLSYSLYVGNIFYRKFFVNKIDIKKFIVGNEILIPTEDILVQEVSVVDKKDNTSALFESCSSGHPNFSCAMELIILFCVVTLALLEFLQIYALGPKKYFREYENILEVLVLTLVSLGLAYQENFTVLKWISAFAICLAYLEFIFLMGRYPLPGGNLSLMFYTITKRLVASLFSMLMLVIGFAFGFFIIHHGKKNEKFETPWRAIPKTLAMLLGEFDFDDLYSAHDDDVYSRAFSMSLLTGLAIMGSLVLVNLIIALIVSDIGMLHKEALLQELINKTQHIVAVESIYNYIFCCCSVLKNKINISNCVFICGHSLCHCPVNSLKKDIVKGLRQILQTRQLTEMIEGLLTCKPEDEVTSANGLIVSILNILKDKGLLQKSSGDKVPSSRVASNLLKSAFQID